jgi:hypothetical protein
MHPNLFKQLWNWALVLKVVYFKIIYVNNTLGCYLKKNPDGFCFDRKGCQSKIEVEKAVKSLKTCGATIKWKQVAGESCECAVGAGVNSLAQYCNLLKQNTRTSRKLSPISS